MSKVKIEGNASGTGTLTISAPNTNTDRTLTLPDGAGEILLSDGDGSALTGISSYADSDALSLFNASGSAPVYACRAWVNFNGTGTLAIRDSGNVSSITDNTTGDYTVNFTTAMQDADYAACFGTRGNATASGNYISAFENRDSVTRTSSALGIYTLWTRDGYSGPQDAEVVSVSIFR